MAENQAELSIGDVASATGVSVYTLRQWERRYGYPVSQKLASGHRRYPREEVARLRLVSKALELGYRAHQVVPQSFEELFQLLNKHSDGANHSLVVERWLQCVKSWNESELTEYCGRDWQMLGPIGFIEQRLAPFLVSLGESWYHKEITISQEHFFSEVIESFLTKKWRPLNEENEGETFILASLDSEEHTLGLHMCAVVLSTVNKKILFLGGPTPIQDIEYAIASNPSSGVCLSFSSSYPTHKAQKEVKALRENVSKDCTVIVGGEGAPNGLEGVHKFSVLSTFYDWLQYEWNPKRKVE